MPTAIVIPRETDSTTVHRPQFPPHPLRSFNLDSATLGQFNRSNFAVI